jgi:membrane protein implicated in regulation of membrane protease activity
MEIIWLALLIVFAITEGVTVALVSIWFMGGALAALIAALCGAELWVQVVLFFAVSILLLLCLRPLSKRLIKQKKVATNADSNIGKEAVVTERIDNLQGSGAVRISGVEWSARSADGSEIEKGAVVRVLRIEGVKVCVERADTNNEGGTK